MYSHAALTHVTNDMFEMMHDRCFHVIDCHVMGSLVAQQRKDFCFLLGSTDCVVEHLIKCRFAIPVHVVDVGTMVEEQAGTIKATPAACNHQGAAATFRLTTHVGLNTHL